MVLDRIFEDEIRKAMREKSIEPIATPLFGWSGRYKVLVVVEKKKELYEVYGVRVYISDGKMHRASVSKTMRNVRDIGTVMDSVAKNTADQWVEGYAIRDPHTSIHMLFTAQDGKESLQKQDVVSIPTAQVPVYGNVIGYVCDRNMQPTANPVSLTEELLLHHVLITGMTGSGKTSIALKIVSEVRKIGKPVLVVTPQPGPWKKMGVHVLTDDDEELKDAINLLDIRSFARDLEETAKTLSSLVDFFSHSEETEELRLLVVFDETHRLMAYEELTQILDTAARELRKYGVGLVFISQSCFDFVRGIRGDIHTHIAMRTVWSNDLTYMKQHSNLPKGNENFFETLRHSANGIGIFYSHFFGHATPYYCKFLEEGKLFQPVQQVRPEQKDVLDETAKRRNEITRIVLQKPNIPLEIIRKELEASFGCKVDEKRIYDDLAALVSEGKIKVTMTGERGKKYYGSGQNTADSGRI
ncbi:MAG TPA: type IV secretory system conjugative DNA transfer family protein [Candidatus Nitrosotenuis sp.]|nr:type IV secretory system conjugative DNA transfer family protein [Candidatus Nitrosotenuis sp.]